MGCVGYEMIESWEEDVVYLRYEGAPGDAVYKKPVCHRATNT